MMKSILVPTDFSPNANNALDFAVQLAGKAAAVIILVHSCDLKDITFQDSAPLNEKLNKQTMEDAESKLMLLKKSVEDTEKLEVRIQIYNGAVAETILKATGDFKADLIVMGTVGNSALKEKILGSTTAAIISKAAVPVMAIPILSSWHIPEKILLAVNEFGNIPESASMVFELAGLFNARLYAVIFTDKDDAKAADYLRDERNIAAYRLKLQKMYKNMDIDTLHLDGHKFQETILRFTEEHNIDIMALITHQRRFPMNILKQSTTRRMSYHVNIPLLSLPAQRTS